MERFWNIFWKTFGIGILLAVVIGIIAGLVSHSSETAYNLIQKTFAVGMGVCGIIAFGVVPVLMYIEDRAQGGERADAVE
jgi:ABC-type nitrate/sulfonate/bicarbonate transport system permease component